ncbi:hypothetical protein BV898_07315 [Hypsibius exemplaris]|uniref:DnaJ homolog subfamily B member 9 n=1 Tax=Hypsibius exemplaris TaxID=2072580 RepID=A0A1W0WU10_HYPEX|nr:hypothetical protein BV898_07315 [Hypsibius exemplaris]
MSFLPVIALTAAALAVMGFEVVIADKCLYSVLGVNPDASQAQLDKAFRKLSLKYHSDDNQFPDPDPRFDEITRAYTILSTPAQRKKYDKDPNSFHAQTPEEEATDMIYSSDHKQDDEEDEEEDDYDSHMTESITDGFKTSKQEKKVSASSFTYSHTTQKDGEEPITHSVSGGFHSGQDCKTITEKKGDTISTRTSCTATG